jgi:hypothetical protein
VYGLLSWLITGEHALPHLGLKPRLMDIRLFEAVPPKPPGDIHGSPSLDTLA